MVTASLQANLLILAPLTFTYYTALSPAYACSYTAASTCLSVDVCYLQNIPRAAPVSSSQTTLLLGQRLPATLPSSKTNNPANCCVLSRATCTRHCCWAAGLQHCRKSTAHQVSVSPLLSNTCIHPVTGSHTHMPLTSLESSFLSSLIAEPNMMHLLPQTPSRQSSCRCSEQLEVAQELECPQLHPLMVTVGKIPR